MKIKTKNNRLLVLYAPAWPILMVGAIVAAPGLLVLFLFLNFMETSSLKCDRPSVETGSCRFTRIGLLRPYTYRFPTSDLKGITTQSSNHGRSRRLALQTSDKTIPFSISYGTWHSRQFSHRDHIEAKVSAFINQETDELKVKGDPPIHWSDFLIFIVVLIPTLLPISIGAVFWCAACSVTLRIDRNSRQVKLLQQGILGKEVKQCSFNDIQHVEVAREEKSLTSSKLTTRKSSIRYALRITLHSGDVLLKYDYFHLKDAEAIAQLIRPMLR